MQYRKTVVAQDETLAISTTVTKDLPVNPISHLVVTLRCLNVTDEATLAELVARLGTITVSRYGENIFRMSAADLQKMNIIMYGHLPILANQVATDNATRTLSLIVPFSRMPFNPQEGLPQTLRGELKIAVEAGSSDAACDNATIQIEAVEMIGASPKQYLKITTISMTPAATGLVDVPLPIGNKYAGIGLFSTTVPTGTAFTTTIDQVKFLLDNVEYSIVSSNWESLHGELLLRCGHLQDYDASANDDDLSLYALIDWSPRGGDEFLVDTSGKTQSTLRITAGDTSALRVFPMELANAK